MHMATHPHCANPENNGFCHLDIDMDYVFGHRVKCNELHLCVSIDLEI